MNHLYDRISAVEEFVALCNNKFDGFGKELGDLSMDVRTVLEWISQHFGTELDCSRNRIRPRIEIQIVNTPPTPAASINTIYTVSTETSTEDPDRAGDGEGGNEIQNLGGANVTQEENGDSGVFDEGSDEPVPTPEPITRCVRPRRSRQSTGEDVLSANEDDAGGDSDVVVINEAVDAVRLPPSNTVPKRGRPCKPILQNKKADPQPSQCDQCGKILKDAGSLRQHKATHKDLRPYVCPECGKAFRRKFHLKTHSLIHSGEKKHQCGYCGKLFLLPKDLVAHERIHTGERPYSCSLCPKSFNLKSHLKMHVRTHTGEKPYKCDLCGKAFTQSNSLRVHKKVHLKNQNNNAVAAAKEAPTASSTVSVAPADTLTKAQNNTNLGLLIEKASPQEYSHSRPSTSRESNEPIAYEVGYHNQNMYSNSVTSKNGLLQSVSVPPLKTTDVPSHNSQVANKSYQGVQDSHMQPTHDVSKSGEQLVSHLGNPSLSLSNDRSHNIVPSSYHTPRDPENENDKYF